MAFAYAHDWGVDASERVRMRASAFGFAGLSVRKYFVVVRLKVKNTFFVRRAHSAHRGMETSAVYQCTVVSACLTSSTHSRAAAYRKVHFLYEAGEMVVTRTKTVYEAMD